VDYPISVPNIGLVAGKFANEDAFTGMPGSLIPAQWGNAVTDEILNVIYASGAVPDEANSAQLIGAIRQVIKNLTPGRLLNIRVFSEPGTTVYKATAGTQMVIPAVQGSGGAGGGAPATTAGNGSLGAPGGAGAFALGFFTAGFDGQLITVGLGGAGVVGGAGNPGAASSFGGLMSCPGGKGGSLSGPSPGNFFAVSGNSNSPSGGNIFQGAGQGGDISVCLGPTSSMVGGGGMSRFGAGAPMAGADTAGVSAISAGAGGGGTARTGGGTALKGGDGGKGCVIVFEIS